MFKLFNLVADNPFPALLDDAPANGYPASEMGYIRAYFDRRNDRWYNTCFSVGEYNNNLADELNTIYGEFTAIYPTLGKLRDMCRKSAKRVDDWCGYEAYEAYMETWIGFFRFIIRFTPGDYNLYLHCYDKWQIPWSNEKRIYDRVMENYECGDEVLNTQYFDFKVSAPESELLAVYARLQKEINGDDVMYPDNLDGKYTGLFSKFLLSCNGKDGYARTNEEIDHLDFAL